MKPIGPDDQKYGHPGIFCVSNEPCAGMLACNGIRRVIISDRLCLELVC